MSISISMHGPFTASGRAQTGDTYGTIGVVKISSKENDEVVIFTPTPETAEAIADAINAAWMVAASKDAEAT